MAYYMICILHHDFITLVLETRLPRLRLCLALEQMQLGLHRGPHSARSPNPERGCKRGKTERGKDKKNRKKYRQKSDSEKERETEGEA